MNNVLQYLLGGGLDGLGSLLQKLTKRLVNLSPSVSSHVVVNTVVLIEFRVFPLSTPKEIRPPIKINS